ncbi:MAG: YbaN family protein [Defluviitaleaceae bacterium]|nr:YbaN family protein [Defluviitaleaceae bacterium]
MKQLKRMLYIIAGFIFLGLGALGIVANFIPFIPFPTTPFLLLASACFSRGSERFDHWFKQTKIYEKYLADFVQTRSMTLKQKVSILSFASASLMIPFFVVPTVPMRTFLILTTLVKYTYFTCLIKTIKPDHTYHAKRVRMKEAMK